MSAGRRPQGGKTDGTKKFYITTAIAYTSRKPHIGNTYDIVLADLIARYKRMMGFDVYFLTGSDEHGQKIEQIAQAEGITPQAYVDPDFRADPRGLGLYGCDLRSVYPHHQPAA